MIGYKLVYALKGRYFSFNMSIHKIYSVVNEGDVIDREDQIEYEVGKMASRNKSCGPLVLFSSLGTAVDAAEQHSSVAVFQAEYTPSDEIEIWDVNEDTMLLDDLIWEFPGTILAENITILNQYY